MNNAAAYGAFGRWIKPFFQALANKNRLSRLWFSPLSLPAPGYHHVILVMGDDPLARFIRTALPGYRFGTALFALRSKNGFDFSSYITITSGCRSEA